MSKRKRTIEFIEGDDERDDQRLAQLAARERELLDYDDEEEVCEAALGNTDPDHVAWLDSAMLDGQGRSLPITNRQRFQNLLAAVRQQRKVSETRLAAERALLPAARLNLAKQRRAARKAQKQTGTE